MGVRSALIGAAIASLAAASMTPAAALTAQECSAKYQAAKAAGTLAGQSWQDFRKAQCGADAAPAAAAAKEAKSEKPEKPARESKAAAPIGNAVFPAAVDPKYAGEKASEGAHEHLRRPVQRQQGDQRQWRAEVDPERRRLLQRMQQAPEGSVSGGLFRRQLLPVLAGAFL